MKTIIVSTLLALGITACMMPEQMKTKIESAHTSRNTMEYSPGIVFNDLNMAYA